LRTKHKAKWRDMRTKGVVGRDRFGDEIGALRMNPGIDVLPVIAIRPSIESAVLHRGQVVRHEVGADLVAFVDDCPQSMALRFPAQPVWVAQAACEDAPPAGRAVHLPDAARFFSASIPFSVMLLFEPTPTYSNDPSSLATRLFVQ